jgi:hypothetical protein
VERKARASRDGAAATSPVDVLLLAVSPVIRRGVERELAGVARIRVPEQEDASAQPDVVVLDLTHLGRATDELADAERCAREGARLVVLGYGRDADDERRVAESLGGVFNPSMAQLVELVRRRSFR